MNYLKNEERYDDICDLLQAIIDTASVILSTPTPTPTQINELTKFTIELSYEKNNNIYVPELYNVSTVERFPNGKIIVKKQDMITGKEVVID